MKELYLFSDGVTSFGITPSFFSVTFDGNTYSPAIVTRSKIERTENIAKSSVTFNIGKTSSFASNLIQTLSERVVDVKIYRDEKIYWTGQVFSAKNNPLSISLECQPLMLNSHRNSKGQIFSLHCWKQIYGANCGLNKTDFAYVREHMTVSSRELDITGHPYSDYYFENGFAEIGLESRRILTHIGVEIILAEAFSEVLSDTTVTFYPVCNLTEVSCASFGNRLQFGGYSKIPNKNPFGATGLL